MAAVSGQPAPKPSQIKSPVPEASLQADFDAALDEIGANPPAIQAATASPSIEPTQPNPIDAEFEAALNEVAPTAQEAEPERPWYDVTGKGLVQGALAAIPTVTGAGGAIIGGLTGGPLGIPAGAAAGGVAGESLKKTLESALFGQKPESRKEFYKGLASEGLTQAEGAMIGELIPVAAKGIKEAMKKAGKALGIAEQTTGTYIDAPDAVKQLVKESNGDIVTAADMKRGEFQSVIKAKRGELEDPALQLMASKGTLATDREVGDQVKNLIKQNVETKYGPFKEAYAQIDQVNKALPLPDEARLKFSSGLKDWALDNFPQSGKSYSQVRQYADAFDASSNGLQFDNVVKELNGEIATAYRMGNTNQAQLLTQVKNRANEFMENRVTKLAEGVLNGKASQQEIATFKQIAANSPVVKDPGAIDTYYKEVAKNFLDNKSKIKSDYAGFKTFMEGLGEQTKIRSKGTFDFINSLDDVPSEKLVSKMFDVKNTRALQQMRKETPEVFDALSRNKVKEMMSDSVGKDGGLDVVGFYQNVQKLPKEVRDLLFSKEDMVTLGKTVLNPDYVKLNQAVSDLPPMLLTPGSNHNKLLAVGAHPERNARELSNLKRISDITGKNLVHDAQLLSAMEHYGKSKLSREQLFKLLLKTGQLQPLLGATKQQAGRQVVGNAAVGAGTVLKDAAIPKEE